MMERVVFQDRSPDLLRCSSCSDHKINDILDELLRPPSIGARLREWRAEEATITNR